jgi:hypothetical protein
MKHLLNDLSEEEKNRIREQHEGGIKIDISKFKKLIETKLGDAKPLINEQVSSPTGGTESIEGGGGESVNKMERLDLTYGSEIIDTFKYIQGSLKPGTTPNTIQIQAFIPKAEKPLNGRVAQFELPCDPSQFKGLVEPNDWLSDRRWLSADNLAPWPVGKQAINLENKNVRAFITQACQAAIKK